MNTAKNQNYWESVYFQPTIDQDSQLLKNIGFIPGLKELLMLRQVHALEHGTIWQLNKDKDEQNLGGLSTEQGFYLYGNVSASNLSQAVNEALRRFKAGEWQLAVHPRCGTNLSVGMLLATGFAFTNQFILPRDFFSQLLGFGVTTKLAMELAPEVGQLVQKYLTTGIPFNLKLVSVETTQDFWGRDAKFVRLQWQDI